MYLLLYITIGSKPRLTSLSFLVASSGVCISEKFSRICSVNAMSDMSEPAAEITSYMVPSAVSISASLSDRLRSLAADLTCMSHETHWSLFVPSKFTIFFILCFLFFCIESESIFVCRRSLVLYAEMSCMLACVASWLGYFGVLVFVGFGLAKQ